MSRDPLGEIRHREYPSLAEGIFLNSASYGLLPLRGLAAMEALHRARGSPRGISDEEVDGILRRCRVAVARLVSASTAEIALAPNTSFGINLAARLLECGEPGVIVVSEGEFPANVFPWLALESRGFRVERIPLNPSGYPDEEGILDRLSEDDVRAFGLSAVQFSSGYRADIGRFGALCGERGVLFVVDAIQGLGATPLDVKALRIDILASGGQKWLCAPWGSGFVFIDRRLHDRFDPPMVSWLSFESGLDYEALLDYRYRFVGDGRKFEFGTLGIQDYLGLALSVELLLEAGIDTVREHILRVQEPLLDWVAHGEEISPVTPMEEGRRAGIFAFRAPALDLLAHRLRERGVVFAQREGAIRLSPHFYNTVEEMEEVAGILSRASE